MPNSYAANIPVSEPKKGNFVSEVDFGGMAWDSLQGIFIPVTQELDRFDPPHPPVTLPNG